MKHAAARRRPEHGITVWVRDSMRTQWAWSCLCGTRNNTDQPTIAAAQQEARTHMTSLRTGGSR